MYPRISFVEDPKVDVLYRFVVISDIHAVGRDSSGYVDESTVIETVLEPRAPEPFTRLGDVLSSMPHPIDAITCCGDLTNRGGIDGYIYGVRRLNELGERLDVRHILVTPGNHDMDILDRSGLANPHACVQSANIHPRFTPVPLTAHRLGNDLFEIYQPTDELIIVNLDTNGPTPTETQGKYGIVTLETIQRLEAALCDVDLPSALILLCHHHPYRHGDIDLADYSELHGAPELFEMMGRLEKSWFIFHGHKHQPRLAYARGGVVAPAIFAAGSFSRTLDKYLQGVARNQCYVVEIIRDTRLSAAHPPVGRFRSLEWASSKWVPSPPTMQSGLPYSGGFGARRYPSVLAESVAALVKASPERRLNHSVVADQEAELRYLVPSDMQRMLRHLLDDHGVYATTQIHDPQPFEYGVVTGT